MNNCPQCGASIDAESKQCKYCGEALPQVPPPPPQQPYAQVPVPPPPVQVVVQNVAPPMQEGISPAWPLKSKLAAGLLGIFLGGLGIHKFYLGQIGLGVVYLLFSWTLIPSTIGLIEGIIYLSSSDHNFQVKHRVRIE